MAFSNLQIREINLAASEFMKLRRPQEEIRDQVDLDYRIEGQSVYIFEIRPRWDKPEEKIESPIAKTTFVKAKNHWKIFWMRGNLKWYHYKPFPYVKKIAHFFEVVNKDELHCFWG
ncbi:MAG: DUF3024 domain-containing protein [Bacteroidetes bacterium]|nr:DUF3024 domain-containing protein [Bacteroidota bacterium]